MQHQVYTHHLHGLASLAGDAAQRLAPGGCGASLLACDGDRLVAVAVRSTLDIYDASNAVELAEYIGSGACKLRSLCSYSVRDAGADVDIRGITFLHGGSVCVYGTSTSSNASVIHVYRLCVSASVDSDAAAYLHALVTPDARSRAPALVLTALPQLIYRAALPGVAALRLVAHPRRAHTFGVTLNDSCDVHFYDAAPKDGQEAGARDSGASAHVCTVRHRSPVDSITFSPDGSKLVLTSMDREIAVFNIKDGTAAASSGKDNSYAPGAHPGEKAAADTLMRVHVRGVPVPAAAAVVASPSTPASIIATHVCSFLAEAHVTAVSVLRIPVHPSCAFFSRFEHNDTCIVTGHDNGFMNVWWCGALSGEAAYTVVTEPIASYPPFHASRGAITHITPAVEVDEGDYGREAPPSLFPGTTSSAERPRSLTTASVLAVGAAGARGWRVYTFEHVLHSSAHAGAVAGVPLHAHRREMPTNVIRGHYVWDARGRRSYVPPAPRVVEHLLQPGVRVPTYAECMRAPVIGDAAGLTSTSVTLPTPSHTGLIAIPRLAAGIIPLGCAVLSRAADAVDGRLELPRAEYVDDYSVFRLLSRAGVASFEHPAEGSTAPARYLQAPRAVLLLLTEKGIHCAGVDYHTALVRSTASTSVESAARAVARTLSTTGAATRASEDAQLAGANTSEDYDGAAIPAADGVSDQENVQQQAAAAGSGKGAGPARCSIPRRTRAVETREDVRATVRARHYWPSAAVSSVVTGVRRTVFSGDASVPSGATALHVRVVRHDADDAAQARAPVPRTRSHASRGPTSPRAAARATARTAAATPPLSATAPRVYSLSELEYMPAHIRARVLRRAAPPPPAPTVTEVRAEQSSEHAARAEEATVEDRKDAGVVDAAAMAASPQQQQVRQEIQQNSDDSPASTGATSSSGFVWQTEEDEHDTDAASTMDDLWAAGDS